MIDLNAKNNKVIKSSSNLFSGVVLKIIDLVVPFVIRTIIIYFLGLEYSGLNSLFVSIIQVLNLAELGIGTALVFTMYKPANENDFVKLGALSKLYRNYYRIIGLVILVIGVILMPFLPLLISGDVPSDINLYVIYIFNLLATVVSYWLFAYRNSLFVAYQRSDIVNVTTLSINLIKYVLQICVLILFKSYYLYLILNLVGQLSINLVCGLLSKRFFPNIRIEGNIDVESKKEIDVLVKDIFFFQIGNVFNNSMASIVISSFLGLAPLAIFQNYYFIINSLFAFFSIFYNSCRAAIGNKLINKSLDENFVDLKFLTFIVSMIISFCANNCLNLYQDFIEFWVGKENCLPNISVYFMVAYFVVFELILFLNLYKDGLGKWHGDKYRPLLTSLVSCVCSIILVNFLGIFGVILSLVVVNCLINLPWSYKQLFTDVFKGDYGAIYIFYFIKNIVILILSLILSHFICLYVTFSNVYLVLLFKFIISSVCTFLIYGIFYFKSSEMTRLINYIFVLFNRMKRK